MKTLFLSGWSQSAHAFAEAAPQAKGFDYGRFASVSACFDALAAEKPDYVIGWSLGGQLAARAISEGMISPQKLVLVAAPYQCAASADFTQATAPEDLAASRMAFSHDPNAMLKQFYCLCALGDSRQRSVIAALLKTRAEQENHHWLYWFDELVAFSGRNLKCDAFPPTTLIYGEADCIVPPAQGEIWAERLPQASLQRIAHCAHAPHLHDAEAVKTLLGT